MKLSNEKKPYLKDKLWLQNINLALKLQVQTLKRCSF